MVQERQAEDESGNPRAIAQRGAAAMVGFIIQGIAQGVFAPGQKLPTERELALRFGLSRNTLRKHLDRLEAEGRIARQTGSGTYVTIPPAGPHRAAGSGTEELLVRIHGASPAEVMEFRLLIEPQMAELAVTRATRDDIRELELCAREGEHASSVEAFEHWDGRLHLVLVQAARNQLVADLYAAINSVRQQALWGRMKERTLTRERRLRYERQHRAIVDALRDRDIDQTRDRLREHLIDVRDGMLGG